MVEPVTKRSVLSGLENGFTLLWRSLPGTATGVRPQPNPRHPLTGRGAVLYAGAMPSAIPSSTPHIVMKSPQVK